MKPFFDLLSAPLERGDETFNAHIPKNDCVTCGRAMHCQTPKSPAIGTGEFPILFIGPSITQREDQSGDGEHGTFHALLKRYVRKTGNKLSDCWYTHAIKCYSNMKKTKPSTIEGCHRVLMDQIKALKPRVIVPTCDEAWNILLHERRVGRVANSSFYDFAGMAIPDQVFRAWVLPIYDVSMVEKYEKNQNKFEPFHSEYIKRVFSYVDVPFVSFEYESKVRTTTSVNQALDWIDTAMKWKVVAFDYETSGIKPHRKGHFIACMSISNGEVSYCFPNFPDMVFQKKWEQFLQSSVIKVAHNASFERSWSKSIFGVDVVNLRHCTMIGQHNFNNKRPTGAKYCAYAYYGIMGYETHSELLETPGEEKKKYGTNGFNRIKEVPLPALLKYCAIDSLIGHWMYTSIIRNGLDEEHQLEGYKFFMEGIAALDRTHENGIRIDMEMVAKQKKRITELLKESYRAVMSHDIITHQWDLGEVFNPSSDANVRHLLFSILHLPIQGKTESGLASVDEEALSALSHKCDIVVPLLEYRRWNKALGTYIGQIEKETVDGVIHPFFQLHKVATFRSGSSAPNFQNLPKRDKEVMDAIRSCFVPRKGHKIVEYDYKACEVSIAAAVSSDPELIRYVSDPTSDMHKDASLTMYFLEPDQVNKALRNVTKGPFIFAEFYGSYYAQTALGMWKELNVPSAKSIKMYGIDVLDHLADHGIDSYADWEEHVKEQERILWEERFPVYQEFRERTYKEFIKKGFVDFVDGFRYYGPSTKNELLNAPVQGPAFHTQLWTFKSVDAEIMKRKMDSCLIGQIHDSIVADVDPTEEAYMDHLMWLYGTQKVREHFPWITVPLMMEKSCTEVDQPWSKMREVGMLREESRGL